MHMEEFKIESRNNKLELQSANNKLLIEELDKLLEQLCIPNELAASLTGGGFDERHMVRNIEACEWLTGAIRRVEVPNLDPIYAKMRAVKEKSAELQILRSTFVHRASEFLSNYITDLVETMINEKSYFSQRGGLKRPDHSDLRYKCKIYARLLQHLKNLDKNCLGAFRRAYCQSLNLLIRREAREFANEIRANTKVPRILPISLEALVGSNQSPNCQDSTAVSDAYAKMLTIFIPMLVDESSFFSHFMCFEVPSLVSYGDNGQNDGPDGTDTTEDNPSLVDSVGNEVKPGISSVELAKLNEFLNELLNGIQVSIMFVTLEKVAQIDPKNADIVLLENYAAFQNSLYDLANVVPTLAKFYNQASESYEQACTRHINMVIYIIFEKLFQFAHRLEELNYQLTPEEIPFQVGMSKAELRKMLKSSLAGIDKHFNALYRKLIKNIATEELYPHLWDKCKNEFLDKYETFVKLVGQVYPKETIMSAADMRDVLASM